MPSFLNPLPPDGSHTEKRKSHELEQREVSSSKKQATGITAPVSGSGTRYWMVQWRAPQSKKHKTWEGDGVLVVTKPKGVLMDLEGRVLTTGNVSSDALEEGSQLSLGNKELQIDRVLQASEYLSGACFGRGGIDDIQLPRLTNSTALSRHADPPTVRLPAPPVATVSQGKAIDLEPVNLLSQPEKATNKKHKTWDGDGYVTVQAGTLMLVSEHGKILGRKPFENLRLTSGLKTFVGGLELELDSRITQSEFPKITKTALRAENENESQLLEEIATTRPRANHTENSNSPIKNTSSSGTKFIPPTTFYAKPTPKPKMTGPLHDPRAEGAVVMKAPTEEHLNRFNKKSLPTVPVVIDPILARRLRPHQVEGIKFMYDCVMGLRKHEGQGCILADEMSASYSHSAFLILTAFNPYAGIGPVVGKVLIVCPVTLVNNWKSEFHKWLGRDRVGVLTGDKGKTAIRQFTNSKIHQVLLIGYERLRNVVDDLVYCNPPIGLIIADEGHRLKSANNKTSAMFGVLKTPRRIILSGTPIQNDLGEFHAMTPIIRSREPGCSPKEAELGESRSAQLLAISRSFVLRRDASILKNLLPPKYEYVVFVTPTALQLSIFSKILNPDRLDDIIENSTAESLALINILTKISNSPILLKAVADKAKAKISQGQDNRERTTVVEEAVKLLPERVQVENLSLSALTLALHSPSVLQHTDEKCIVVSHYTSTLNIVEAFCKKKSYSYLRLDGSTPAAKRSEHVNMFNRSSQERCFLFLLSSKAGGVGLNLIGASRLCLVDSDWNPRCDALHHSEIYSHSADGQKRSVYIYRFLTAGTIDEKIYQRQITKLGLSNSMFPLLLMRGEGKSDSKSDTFTHKELRDIFTIHPGTACHSHDLLDCPCDRIGTSGDDDATSTADIALEDDSRVVDATSGFIAASQVNVADSPKLDKAYLKKKKAELASLGEWTHINCLRPDASERVHDDILRSLLFRSSSSHGQQVDPVGSSTKSRISSLLDAVDLDNISRMGTIQDLTVKDVPGGTVSFLFEKGTPMSKDEDEDVTL
ncbi:P-loop containing nucleoside triphosphate hydrolase protein [Russula vinacea]|nr:P-loop containing nucleoside triphosphate hydrolase protein [Russula vinacea]